MSRKTILEMLDASVLWVGKRLWGGRVPKARPLRWTSTIALIIAFSGFALLFVWPSRQFIGGFWITVGMMIGSYMPIFGPLKPWGAAQVDERERAIRAQAYLVTLFALAAVAVVGSFLIVGWSMMDDWSIWSLRGSMLYFSLLLVTIWGAGPTCSASWIDRPLSAADLA